MLIGVEGFGGALQTQVAVPRPGKPLMLVFPEEEIVATLWGQLRWSHFREPLPLKRPFQREFYAEMCRIEGWNVRTL